MPGGDDFKTNWEAFQKERIRKEKERKIGEKEEKKTKGQKIGLVGKIKGKWKAKKDDFAVTILGSLSNRIWGGFQNRWNNIQV